MSWRESNCGWEGVEKSEMRCVLHSDKHNSMQQDACITHLHVAAPNKSDMGTWRSCRQNALFKPLSSQMIGWIQILSCRNKKITGTDQTAQDQFWLYTNHTWDNSSFLGFLTSAGVRKRVPESGEVHWPASRELEAVAIWSVVGNIREHWGLSLLPFRCLCE